MSKMTRSELAKKIVKGQDVGKPNKPGTGFEAVASKAAETYGSEEAGKRVAAAAMWKNLSKKGK
jgi:hypothetical protein